MGKWGSYAKATQTPGGDGKYIKLQDGQSVKFAVTDAPPGKEITHWKDGAKVAEGTPGSERNEKVVLCVYDLELLRMRVLRMTRKTFADLADKLDEFGENRAYRIKRYKDQKGFVAYAVDQIDRLEADTIDRIRLEDVIDILSETDVWPLELAEEKPAPPKPAPSKVAEKPRTPNTKVSAMPPESMPLADEEVPF